MQGRDTQNDNNNNKRKRSEGSWKFHQSHQGIEETEVCDVCKACAQHGGADLLGRARGTDTCVLLLFSPPTIPLLFHQKMGMKGF